jgi:hypothetical protein
VHEESRAVAVLPIGGAAHHLEHDSLRVDRGMALASLHLFERVVPAEAPLTRLDTLTVEDRGAGRRLASQSSSGALAQRRVDLLLRPGGEPGTKVIKAHLPRQAAP